MTKDKKQYFVPSTNSTKYKFLVVGASEPITIIREEQWFYQLEQDNQKKPLGNLVSTCQYLYRCQAQWLTKDSRRKRMFYNRETAVTMLREGYTVVHIESGNRISYTEDYSRIVCSSSIVLENDVPPGNFCIDFTESKLAKTYNEVKTERLFAKVQEEKLEKEKKERKSEAQREAAKKLFDKIEERNRKEAAKNQLKRDEKEDSSASIPRWKPVENDSSNNPFFKFVGAAAIFLGGLGLGLLIKN